MSGAMFSGLMAASAVLHRDLLKDCMTLHKQIKKREAAAGDTSDESKKTKWTERSVDFVEIYCGYTYMV